MKKLVFIFLLFSTITFAQKDKSEVNDLSSFEPNEIVKKIKKTVELSADQEKRISQHLKNKKEFLSTSELSDLRKESVLNSYKEEFDNILSVEQSASINKKDKKLYIYLTKNY